MRNDSSQVWQAPPPPLYVCLYTATTDAHLQPSLAAGAPGAAAEGLDQHLRHLILLMLLAQALKSPDLSALSLLLLRQPHRVYQEHPGLLVKLAQTDRLTLTPHHQLQRLPLLLLWLGRC